jgi:pyrimidine operon attenuation protein/uracil phosphoribosyltransferase
MKIVLKEKEMDKIINRLVHEIIEKMPSIEKMGLIGIRTGGVFLAQKIKELLYKIEGIQPPFGILDITLYRDDLSVLGYLPTLKKTDIQFSIDDKPILLVDDVIFSGRTIRAAMDAIIDFGRPSCIELAVLIDRGGRELPIQPDFCGKKLEVAKNEIVDVRFREQGYDYDCVIKKKRSAK